MPAKAPCPEVAEEVKTQARIVGAARLMAELAAATKPPQVQFVPLPPPQPEVVSRPRAPLPVRVSQR